MGIKLATDDYNIIEEKEIENELLLKECKLLQNTIYNPKHNPRFFKLYNFLK